MPDNGEALAIIRRPRCGASDRGTVALMFSTYITDSSAADQFLDMERDPKAALDLLRTVGDVTQLEGAPCWVDVSRPGLIVYLRPAKAGR